MLNVGSTSTIGLVVAVKDDLVKIKVSTPVCTDLNVKVSLSRRIEHHWRLIGWGKVRKGMFCT